MALLAVCIGLPRCALGTEPMAERVQLVNRILVEAHAAAIMMPDNAESVLVAIAIVRAEAGDTDGALAVLEKPGTSHLGKWATKYNFIP